MKIERLDLKSENLQVNLSEEEDTAFDQLIQSRWMHLMSNGHFRYDLSTMKSRQVGKFVAQLNPMRATTRRQPQSMQTVRQKFDQEKFNFNKAPLEKELVCEIRRSKTENVCDITDSRDVIIINVSPIDIGHCLLVPSLEENLPQILTESSIRLALQVAASSGRSNFKMAFNSLCAYASVNHLHWHMYYLQNHQLYLETCSASRLAGECFELRSQDYPGQGFVFQVTDNSMYDVIASSVFKLVNFLSLNDVSHNVFITRGSRLDHSSAKETSEIALPAEIAATDKTAVIRVFVWARQNIVGNKDPKAFVIAVCELSGQLLIYEEEKYRTITEEEIADALTETCQTTFDKVRPKVIDLFKS